MSDKCNHYLICLIMTYLTIDLSSMVFAYKIVGNSHITMAASSLIFPLTYALMDIIAEVFGVKTAKKVIFFGLICDLIFASLLMFICSIPSLDNHETIMYEQVLGGLLRATIAQMAGVIFGSLINITLISRWKIMTNGRYFWLRSIGSSTIGELAMLIISVSIALIGILPLSKIVELILITYGYKVVFAIIMAPFINVCAVFLKRYTKNEFTDNFAVSSA